MVRYVAECLEGHDIARVTGDGGALDGGCIAGGGVGYGVVGEDLCGYGGAP